MTSSKLCPCQSNLPYNGCCHPLISGAHTAATAESLMRSRFTAYMVRDVNYILKTWHPSTRPSTIDSETIPDWNELQIIRTENGQKSDDTGIVEFKAIAIADNQILSLSEVSRFVKEDGQWFYVDGGIMEDAPPAERKEPKVSIKYRSDNRPPRFQPTLFETIKNQTTEHLTPMIFSFANDKKTVIATIHDGNSVNKYECLLEYCNNPICSCGSVSIKLDSACTDNEDSKSTSCVINFDVIKNEISTKGETDECKNFLKLISEQIKQDDYLFLYNIYFSYKNKITELSPSNSIESYFNYSEIEKNGLMSAYNDVLPFGDQLLININGNKHLVADQYCLLPDCKCTDTTLTIFSSELFDSTGEELCVVNLKYADKKWGNFEHNSSPLTVKELKNVIEEQIPDVYSKLKQRHTRIKSIYAHCKKKNYAPQEPLRITKVGRNDPCPCSSGKKFKKCCGA